MPIPSGRKYSWDPDRNHGIIEEDKHIDDDDTSDRNMFPEYETNQLPMQPNNTSQTNTHRIRRTIPTSRTLDSLVELQHQQQNSNKQSSTPSTSSSGYGSQAVSSTNLTSEDSLSLKSISVDETPDIEVRPSLALCNDLQPVTEDNSASGNDITTTSTVEEQCVESSSSITPAPTSPALVSNRGCATTSSNSSSSEPDAELESEDKNIAEDTTSEDQTAAQCTADKTGAEYDSPTEGTSIVKTKLSPGKVCSDARTVYSRRTVSLESSECVVMC